MTTMSLRNALVLHWLVFVHSQMGIAAVTESIMADRKSTLRLRVAFVKVYAGAVCVTHNVALKRYGVALAGVCALTMGQRGSY